MLTKNLSMKQILSSPAISLYEVLKKNISSSPVRKFIVSTPETRAICNDPFIIGTRYTETLKAACVKCIKCMTESKLLSITEENTNVLHILRGGLNFGLREALSEALGFNLHSSAFISAQRARKLDCPSEWVITENSYSKVNLLNTNDMVFGDVVATGTSLEHALRKLGQSAREGGNEISSVTFFTIGGPRSYELMEKVCEEYRSIFKNFKAANVIFFEGIFSVAETDTKLRLKIDGTDLIRVGSLMAPEFIESQYESPSYALERCTIYDAGSRSFFIPEYIEDVRNYWEQIARLAKEGGNLNELVKERFPELSRERLKDTDLGKIALSQLSKADAILKRYPHTGAPGRHEECGGAVSL